MTPQEALGHINGARFVNYSGQIIEQRDGRDRYIVCEIGCNCSEIPGKISDEYGEARHASEQRQRADRPAGNVYANDR